MRTTRCAFIIELPNSKRNRILFYGIDEEQGSSTLKLTVLFNGREEKSELLVLRANDVSSGPIARVPIGIAVPHGYHGCFAPSADDANWTYEEIERRAKLADKMETRGSIR